MMNETARAILAGAILSSFCAPGAPAGAAGPGAANEWAAARAARFAAWRAANPDADARLRRAAADTRALLAAERTGREGVAAAASPPVILRTRDSEASYWECAACPELVVVPAGRFSIGSPVNEPGRTADEGPQRRLAIDRPLAVGKFEVTRGEYETFLLATGHPISGNCVTDRAHQGTFAPEPRTNLRDPGFPQTDDHPVVCVTWDDAQAYVAWINAQTGGGYRLATEAEFEYVSRAGSTTTYPWGPSADSGCMDANMVDAAARRKYPDWPAASCDDGALNTAPVGSYRANAFGLHDTIGNVEEWVEDCATPSYDALPADGSATRAGDCARHMVRSGSWGAVPADARAANRIRYPTRQVDDSIGFRLAKTIG